MKRIRNRVAEIKRIPIRNTDNKVKNGRMIQELNTLWAQSSFGVYLNLFILIEITH